jgi:hypothetical protein
MWDNNAVERIVHISRSFEEAEQWNIEQNVSMTPEERLVAARELAERGNHRQRRYYHPYPPPPFDQDYFQQIIDLKIIIQELLNFSNYS